MTGKVIRNCALAIVLTGLAAPVLHAIKQAAAPTSLELGNTDARSAQKLADPPVATSQGWLRDYSSFANTRPLPEPRSAVAGAPALPASQAQVIHVTVQGAGWTPAEADRDALQNALRQAVIAQAGAKTWAKLDKATVADMGNDKSIITGWKEIAGKNEWRLRGTWHRKEIAVAIDTAALAERLRERAARPQRVGQAAGLPRAR